MLKKSVILLISSVLVFSFFLPVNADQTSDTFDITVTGEYIWIDVTNASWNLGVVSMSSVHYTNETGVTFIADMDNSTVNTDLKLQITGDATDWSSATSGNTPVVDTYRLDASIDTWVASDDQIVSASATTISSNIASGNNETFDLRFSAPTSTSTGSSQTITTTASLVKT